MKLKRLAAIAVAVAVMLFCVPCSAFAAWRDEGTFGDFTYRELQDGTLEITDYNGTDENVVIPDTIDGKRVTVIGGYTFVQCDTVTNITIPDTVTMIFTTALGCDNLKEINIPASVTHIEIYNGDVKSGRPFPEVYGKSLAKINVAEDNSIYKSIDGVVYSKDGSELLIYPRGKTGTVEFQPSVTRIGDGAFAGCTSLTSIEIPDTVTSIGKDAFYFCRNLSDIKLPEGITSLNYTFYGCTSLKSIEIPDGVTNIDGAFYGCTSLSSVEIPDNVVSMDDAFCKCTSLTSIDIPDGVTSIDGAFQFTPLTSVEIPDSVTNMDYAFNGCTSLASIEIPNSVISIAGAFRECTSLISIDIPNSVTNIEDAFNGCTSLFSIKIPNSVTSTGDPGIILHGAFQNCSSLTSIEIPNSVTCIGGSTFRGCTALKSIEIPNSVTCIGWDAFGNCTSLTSINIPESVTEIYGETFAYCTSLASVNIPDSVTRIGRRAFADCAALTSIVIPESVSEIEKGAFSRGDDLERLIIYGFPNSAAQAYPYNNSDNVRFVEITSTDFDLTPKSISDESSRVSLDGIFYNGTTLNVVEDKSVATDNTVLYNITLRNSDGAEVQPIDSVTVKIPVPDGWDGEKCSVFRVEQNGSYTNMDAVYSDGFMVFSTRHFSDYILHSELPSVPVEVSSVTIKKTPTKTSYIRGTALRLDGGVITVLYTDGSSKDMEMSADGVTVSGYNKNKVGTQTISVTYDGKSAEFTVKVSRPSSGSGGSGGSGGSSSGGSGGSWRDDYSDDTEHTHRFGEWATTESATCRSEGERVRTCSICGEKETDRIPVADHDYLETAAYPARGLNAAYSDLMCVYCLITKREYAATAGDVDGNGVINSLDAAKIIIASVNGEKLDPAAADISGDGKVNSLDAAVILRMIVGL